MINKRRIYALKGLPPEIVAVAFAKSSRSPEPFDEIANSLTEEGSSRFHKKWVVGYGHSSVAEHAVLSLAIENVSILATKAIEDNRLASFTEKSTRYQVFDRTKYYKPKNLMASDLGELYEETSDFLFDSYAKMIKEMIPFLEKKYPAEGQSERVYRTQIMNKALDNLRCILPVSTLTNLGMTINARSLEHAAVKILSSPLEELREIGEELKSAGLKVTPTLIKYVEPNPYLISARERIRKNRVDVHVDVSVKNSVDLVEYDEDAEEKVIAGILYRCSDSSYSDIMKSVKEMSGKERQKIIDDALSGMEKFDWPLRELEHTYYTFDILMDYGAFRDIQRHRMVTQTNQGLTILHGYSIPDEVVEAGLEDAYKRCMSRAGKAFDGIRHVFPDEASYIVPMAFRKRTLFKCNLRELYHFIKLRSGRMGHISYRRIAQQMYDLVNEKHPLLAKYISVDKG